MTARKVRYSSRAVIFKYFKRFFKYHKTIPAYSILLPSESKSSYTAYIFSSIFRFQIPFFCNLLISRIQAFNFFFLFSFSI